jgi:hypothetical protein
MVSFPVCERVLITPRVGFTLFRLALSGLLIPCFKDKCALGLLSFSLTMSEAPLQNVLRHRLYKLYGVRVGLHPHTRRPTRTGHRPPLRGPPPSIITTE